MATDHIRYDVLARDALRGVLRKVLTDAAAHGLPLLPGALRRRFGAPSDGLPG